MRSLRNLNLNIEFSDVESEVPQFGEDTHDQPPCFFITMASRPSPREIVASLISSIQTTHESSTHEQSSNPLRDAPHHTQKALLTLHVLFPNELLPALDVLDRNLVTRLKLHHEAEQDTTNPRVLPGPLPGERVLPQEEVQLRQLRDVPNLQALRHLRREDEDQVDEVQAHARTARRQSPHHRRVQSLDGQDQALRHERPDAGLPAVAAHSRHAEVYVVRSGQLPSRLRVVNHTTGYEVRLDAWSCSCPAFAFSAFPAASSEKELTHDVTHEHTHDSRSADWIFGGLTLASSMPVCKHLLACALVEHSSIFASLVEEREVSIEELAGWAAGWGD